MEEGTSKAIPLRRARNGTRAVVAQPAKRWTERLTTSARSVLSPPHQLWLASLGGTALVVRGARTVWSRAVTEGAAVEGWLRQSVGGREADTR